MLKMYENSGKNSAINAAYISYTGWALVLAVHAKYKLIVTEIIEI